SGRRGDRGTAYSRARPASAFPGGRNVRQRTCASREVASVTLVLCRSSCSWHRPLIPRNRALPKPSFSALVMFHVSEAAARRAGKAEVEFLDVRVFPQCSGLAV